MPLRFQTITRCMYAGLFSAVLLTAVPPIHAQSNVIYVDAGASGVATGADWQDAFTDLQDALAGAQAGDEIRVAAGIYYPGSPGDREATFSLVGGVAVYGGFPPGGGSEAERDWEAHPTVLSGDIDDNDNLDTNGVVLHPDDIVGENSYTVVTVSGGNENTLLDGFHITAGLSSDAGSGLVYPRFGAGMDIILGSPTLNNLIFRGNRSFGHGGAVYCHSSGAPAFSNVFFVNNVADYPTGGYSAGGGMYSIYGCSPALTEVYFSGNSATVGGGYFANDSGSPVMTDVIFESNHVTTNGGGFGKNNRNAPTLTRVVFTGNTAGSSGGGMYAQGNGVSTLTDVTFTNNTAIRTGPETHGGGLFVDSGAPILTNVVFTGNTATNGGGIHNLYGASPVLTNVVFYDNVATNNGGAISNLGSQGSARSNPVLVNVTLSGNTAVNLGGAMHSVRGNPVLTNVIAWGNSAGVAGAEIYGSGSATIAYSLVDSCNPQAQWNSACGTDGGGNLADTAPWFVDADQGNLRLLHGSPAIDAGDDDAIAGIEHDLDGNPRLFGAAVDLGAYEAGPVHTVTSEVTGGQGNVAPPEQIVDEGGDAVFTVAPATGWQTAGVIGDTCTPVDQGGGTWTAENITADCAVSVIFAINEYTVTATASDHGTVSPATQTVVHGDTAGVTVNPDPGYGATISGDCPPGVLDGNSYTIGAITADCAIEANFTLRDDELFHDRFEETP